MDNSPLQTPTPDSFASAARVARTMIKGLEGIDPLHEQHAPPTEMFDYFFTLQSEIEKSGDMDYRAYASQMWDKFLPNVTQESPGFQLFSDTMVAGLHGIDMSELVHPDVNETMPQLLEVYCNKIEGLAIWSTGDVAATGYQLGKIHQSRVIPSFLGTLKQSMDKPTRSEFVRKKTSYLVADNKFDSLVGYISKKLPDAAAVEPLKVVIIEDSSGNFDKAQTALKDHVDAGKVEIVPIWYTGSREGRKAQDQVDAMASGDPETYTLAKNNLDTKKVQLNAIGSFTELLDTERFGDIFDGAHVMVDFDGVIGDNIRMRQEQAGVIYNALLSGASTATGLDTRTLESHFQTVLQPTPQN